MIITPAPEPDSEKDPKKRRNYIFHVWFYIMLITPLIILYYSNDTPIMSGIIGSWIGIIGPTIVLSGIIELIINVLSRKRPLLSLNNRFIIITTCWAALFLVGYFFNLSEDIQNGKNRVQTGEQNEVIENPDGLSMNQMSIREMLLSESKAQNEKCPIKINQTTQLDSTSVLSWNIFQMHYSFIYSKETMNEFYESIDYDGDKEKESLQEQFNQMYRTQDYLKDLRTKRVTLQASYYDVNGTLLYTLSATPGVDF